MLGSKVQFGDVEFKLLIRYPHGIFEWAIVCESRLQEKYLR